MQADKGFTKCFVPMPATKRGYSCPFFSTPDGKYFAYCSKTSVIFRSFSDVNDIKVFSKHDNPVVAFAFHPKEPLVASIDTKNNLFIWDINTLNVLYNCNSVWAGITNGIIFTPIPNVVIVFGNLKGICAHAVNYTNPQLIMEGLTELPQTILAGDANMEENGLLFLGGEDFTVSVYKSNPIEPLKKHDKIGTKFISSIKISPDGTKVISVGFDKNITVFDAKTGEMIEQLTNAKSPGNHTMSMMSIIWVDNDKFITCSLDKTIKIWSLSEKKCTLTLKTAEKPDVGNMVNGVASDGKVISAITLNGQICVWKLESATEGKLPDLIINGHQETIKNLLYLKQTKEIFSSDLNGVIIKWNEEGISTVLRRREQNILAMQATKDEKYLYCIERNCDITCTDIKDGFKEVWKIECKGNTNAIYPSESDNETCYVLYKDAICVYKKEKEIKRKKLDYDSTCFEVNEPGKEIYIGDKRGKVHFLDLENLNQTKEFAKNIAEITVLRLSPDKKFLADGDSQRGIYVWNTETKEVVNQRASFHQGKIFDISWCEDNNLFYTCSADGSIVLVNNEKQEKVKQYKSAGSQEIYAVITINEKNDFIYTGRSGIIYLSLNN